MKLVLIFIFSTLIGIATIFTYHLTKIHPNEPVKSIIQNITQPSFSIENAPSDSIKGRITNMSGIIEYESRTATAEGVITSPVTLQQGEIIQTGINGMVNLDFPNESQIKVLPKTEVDFIQTLPINFVVNIASGSAQISKEGSIPVTIRALHLLIRINSGNVTTTVNQENSIVSLEIVSGKATVAYNDNNLNSHTMDFESGQKVTFNNLTRGLK